MLRLTLVGMMLVLTGCSAMEFNPHAIDVDRLPIDKHGNFFLGREIVW